jgi:hypothetical protein
LVEGSTKYQVDVRVRSLFDGVIPDYQDQDADRELERLLEGLSGYSEEELTRQVYEDDIFIMCPPCKEAFMQDIYSNLHQEGAPDDGRDHLIN